jgi:rhodanese-related sulfurtransferase
MKKILLLIIIAISIFMPLSEAIKVTKNTIENTYDQFKNVLDEDQTHAVLAEYVSKTTCPYCPPASSQLYSIYNSDDYEFNYVTFVTDKISELSLFAQPHLSTRIYDELGVRSVPDVYFDGGYTNIKGRQEDEQPYRTAIEQSGSIIVPQIDMDLNVEWTGTNIIKITAQIQIDDPEYDGNIKIYITEINSRWKDYQGNNYHYAVLDIPVDQSLKTVNLDKSFNQQSKSQTQNTVRTITKWWTGSINKNNCMVIAAVFDKDTDYAIQTTSAKPVASSVNDLSFNTNGYTNITVQETFENYLSCYCFGVQIPIDIRRTEDEYNVEHLETWGDEQEPVNWPNLQEGENLDEFMNEYSKENVEIILYCRTARRTWDATKLLIDNGFKGTIYNMVGGINAWKDAGYPTAISADKANTLWKSDNQIFIDIRTKEEWKKEHIKGSVNYPDLHQEVGIDEFITQYDDKEVIIYCKSGDRSNEAADILIEKKALGEFNGYFHTMIGGMEAWKDAGYPTPRSHYHFAHISHTVLQKFLDIFPNSFPFLRNLVGL